MPSRRFASLVVGPGLAALLLTLLLPHRPDRAGHFLAGFGMTLVASWLVAVSARGSRAAVCLAVLACIGLGHLVEAYVFPLGGYDFLDVSSQSVGALHAGAALLLGRAGAPDDDGFDWKELRPSPYGRQILITSQVAFLLGAWRAFA